MSEGIIDLTDLLRKESERSTGVNIQQGSHMPENRNNPLVKEANQKIPYKLSDNMKLKAQQTHFPEQVFRFSDFISKMTGRWFLLYITCTVLFIQYNIKFNLMSDSAIKE